MMIIGNHNCTAQYNTSVIVVAIYNWGVGNCGVWVRGAGGAGVGAGRPGGGRPLPPLGSGGITPGKFLEIYITVGEFSCHFEVGALQWVVVKKTLNGRLLVGSAAACDSSSLVFRVRLKPNFNKLMVAYEVSKQQIVAQPSRVPRP